MTSADRIGDFELNAYVDGQLDAAGRLEVEEHLARHPALAARVMADLSLRDSLRLAFPAESHVVPEQTKAWALKLEKSLKIRRAALPLRRMAAAVAIFALGWSAHIGWYEITRAPDQAAVVAEAQRLGEKLDVRLPRIPEGWQMMSARLTETANGPGLEIRFKTPEFGHLSLVARHTDELDLILPTVQTDKSRRTALWQLVSDRYYLTAKLGEKPLETAALELYQTLY